MARNEFSRREILRMAGRLSLVVAGGSLTAGLTTSCDIGGAGTATYPGCKELSSRTDSYGNTYRELICPRYLYQYGTECYGGEYLGARYLYNGDYWSYTYTGRNYYCRAYERAT